MVPSPTALSQKMYPSFCLTIPYTVANPNPVPLPRSLVVKNGSKIRARTSGDMPEPVSVMISAT